MPPMIMIATASNRANLMKPPPIGFYSTQPVLARIWSATLALAIVHGKISLSLEASSPPASGAELHAGDARRVWDSPVD